MADEFGGYAAWYSWARSHVAEDAVVCHTAAAAATRRLAEDGDREAAAEAARAAARDQAALAWTRAGYGPRYQYVEWFAWARDNLGLPDSHCHDAARRALDSLSAGGSSASAAEAATRVMLPSAASGASPARPAETPATRTPVAVPTPVRVLARQFTGDALLSILFGIASIAAPIVTHLYFPVLPIAGIWRAVLAIHRGRVAGGVVGIGVCMLGCVTSLMASGLLNH